MAGTRDWTCLSFQAFRDLGFKVSQGSRIPTCENSHKSGDHVHDANDQRGQECIPRTGSKRGEELRGVEDDSVDPRELLEERHRDADHQLRTVLSPGGRWGRDGVRWDGTL